MELLGFSLLASREQSSSSPLRATGEEGALSVRVDQETCESKGEACSDFAALLSLLFPGSSPEDGGKSWEQHRSTAFDQGNHVEALFPQSSEEALPSSPESVPTHGVSSALSSPLTRLADQRAPETRLSTDRQEKDLLSHALFLVDFPSQNTSNVEMPHCPVHTDGESITKSVLAVIGGPPNPHAAASVNQEQHATADSFLFQELVLSKADDVLVHHQLNTIDPVHSAPSFDQESQTQASATPEQEDTNRQFQELSSLPEGFLAGSFSTFAHLDNASVAVSAQGGSRTTLPSSSEQGAQGGYAQGFPHQAENERMTFSATTKGGERITGMADIAPLASAAFKSASRQESTPGGPPLPAVATPNDALRTLAPVEQQEESLSVLPSSADFRPVSTADVSDAVYVPVGGQHNAAALGSQQFFTQTAQAGRTSLVGQPAARSYTTENIPVESYGDAAPGPTLPLDGSAEVKSRLHSQDTHPPEAGEARFARTHVTSAFPSPGETASLVPSTGFALPQSASLLIQPQVPPETVVIEQVAGQIATHMAQGSTQATLTLEPQELGHVQIDLVVQGDQVQVSIVTETAEAGTLIQTHLLELKSALQQHNLELGTVNVDVNTRDGERGTLAQDSGQHFGPHNGGRSGEPPTPQPDTEQTERHRPDPRAPLPQQGVSVWA